ncbi:MAG TPA: lysylphosphatidylglycerol synthase transmembrane domain-containing protein [Myxococcales bacterium]|nr:lysylphosphatidylglycerol synthase transmembrane domain-containing protein [Myxococcales bacterium]
MSETAAARPRLRVLGWLGAAALVALAARRIDFASLAATLRGAQLPWLLLALACNAVANTSARVRRWEALLSPLPCRKQASFLDLARLLYAGYACSNLLPARAGEAVRVLELHRRRGYPASGLVAVQLGEKMIEALSLGLVCGSLALLPGQARGPLVLAGSLALAGVVLLLSLPRRVPAEGGGFLHALRTVHARRSWARSLLWSMFSDTTDLLLVALCARTLGIDAPPAAWGLVLISVNLAILLPSTPGQVGVLEAGAVVALASCGVAPAPALAFALVYHAVHLVPSTTLGLLGMCLPWDRD